MRQEFQQTLGETVASLQAEESSEPLEVRAWKLKVISFLGSLAPITNIWLIM